MPVRMSEAYADPLGRMSTVSVSQGTSASSRVSPLKPANERTVTVAQESQIEWSNLIFMPFHPVFRMFVICSAFIKAMMGPIQSVFPIVYCDDAMDHHPVLIFIKYIYWYGCDSFYGIDTFLHIVHRQVVDKAVRREHLPKAVSFLILDLLSLIPFHRLLEDTACPTIKLWPNLLAFNEFLVIYRVTEYFSLTSTHSFLKLTIGYTIVLSMCINCLTCLLLLLTAHGLCDDCSENTIYNYDWRSHASHRLDESVRGFKTYAYGGLFVILYVVGLGVDVVMPSTIAEFILVVTLLLVGYIIKNFLIFPKTLAEASLRLRKICIHYGKVAKVVEETERRNPSIKAPQQVLEFYKMIWTKRSGVVYIPKAFPVLPRYLRIDIKLDLLWPLFYHSPLLRKTTLPFRRWLSQYIEISYKFPGEKFYAGPQSNSTLYYIKSGIIQLISADDGTTPILSVTSGTIFGDISSLVPHLKRKVMVRCVTYCEIYYLTRRGMILGLHKYGVDRKYVLSAVKNRMEHAKVLFKNKEYVRGIDRNIDEGVAWIKRRWWEIFNAVDTWSKLKGKDKEELQNINGLPREESIFHCAKYIGQLVLCTPTELQTQSMFVNMEFPWILNPQSNFGYIWHKIFSFTVLLVLYSYPVNLIKPEIPNWFLFFTFWVDLAYAFDIGVSLCTAMKQRGIVTSTFYTLLFQRFKSFTFLLDLASTIYVEDLAEIVGMSEYYWTLQFNRVIRIYTLFHGEYLKWDITKNPLIDVIRNIILIHIANSLITCHVVYELEARLPNATMEYFFGEELCQKFNMSAGCEELSPYLGAAILWTFEQVYNEFNPSNLTDVFIGLSTCYLSYCVGLFVQSKYVAYLYFKNRETTKYQGFVTSLKEFYQHYGIHQDLLKRLDRYLICHWKYYRGTDVMYPNTLKDEPIEVYYRAQGEVAEKIIGKSQPFVNANPALTKELACLAKFLVLPRNASLIMFGIHCKNVTWVVQGTIKSETHGQKGELLSSYIEAGQMLSVSSVFFSKASLRSYSAYTECEIIYIPIGEFMDVFKRYEAEYSILEVCRKEFDSEFDDMFMKYVMQHKDYQTTLRNRINSTRMSMVSNSKVLANIQEHRSLPFEGEFWGSPETSFLQTWMMFRTCIVGLSIMSASCLGGIGAVFRWIFMMISAFCDCIAWIDIIFKLFLHYYDDRGILITSKKMCFLNYFTKGFILDIIGVIPVYQVAQFLLTEEISVDNCLLMNTICKFAHIYILFAYFEYVSDLPTVNISYVTIIKWQIVTILIVFGASHYLMVNCVNYVFNANMDLIDVERRNDCWMPNYIHQPVKLNKAQLHLIFVQSISLAQSGMIIKNIGRFSIDREQLGVGFILIAIGIIIWFISCYTVTLLVLSYQGDTAFRQGVIHLHNFLTSERVDKNLIETVMRHLRYCWIRTKGTNIQELMNDRIGVVFRQDLSYYFYKKTLSLLGTIIGGGDLLQRHLASVATQAFFLPDQDIFREMDLVSNVCIVHRGKVNVMHNGKKVIVLTKELLNKLERLQNLCIRFGFGVLKNLNWLLIHLRRNTLILICFYFNILLKKLKGDIFGQLKGTKLRPIRVTATTVDKVDLLYIDFHAFQSIITDQVKGTIAKSPQSKLDFMASKNITIENPYDTVQYLLRGRKTILLPWSKQPTESRDGTWYARWLHLSWFISPFLSTIFVLNFAIVPENSILWFRFYIILFITDAIQIAQTLSDFYTIELTVDQRKCVYKRVGWQKFKSIFLYLDILSLLLPLMTVIDNDWTFQLARLLRLHQFLDFRKHFCINFKKRIMYMILKFAIILLLLHFFTCGWIVVACRNKVFPIDNIPIEQQQKELIVDPKEWLHTSQRKAGCARATLEMQNSRGDMVPGFVVPRHWPHDYIVALTYIILLHTHTDADVVMALSLKEVYYKCAVTYFLHLIDLWIMAAAINYAYNLGRELYQYDYSVINMISYFTDCGLCQAIKNSVLEYTKLVWKKEKGDWLPELAFQLPPCLQHDVFSALYIHHLDAPPSFRELPNYFKRQVCARLKRVVVFPGKCIVREGDTFNTTYFIHEGELEKWYNDISGEGKMLSILYTNGYFGCISGLFPDRGFEFTYYSRTVVDLVLLHLEDWEDLLTAYPDMKQQLYACTKEIRKEYAKDNFGKPPTASLIFK